MRVDLDNEVAQLITQRVEDGRYTDATAVVREAMQLLEEREKHSYLRTALAEANAQIDRGEYVEWSPELMDQLVEESEEMYRLGMKPHPDVCPLTAVGHC